MDQLFRWILYFWTAHILDVVSTYLVMRYPGSIELNPLGFNLWSIMIKVLIVFVILPPMIYYYYVKINKIHARWIMQFLTWVVMVAVIINTSQFVYLGVPIK